MLKTKQNTTRNEGVEGGKGRLVVWFFTYDVLRFLSFLTFFGKRGTIKSKFLCLWEKKKKRKS